MENVNTVVIVSRKQLKIGFKNPIEAMAYLRKEIAEHPINTQESEPYAISKESFLEFCELNEIEPILDEVR